MVRAVCRAYGVSNLVQVGTKTMRCLFLDIDTEKYPNDLVYYLLKKYGNILMLRTKHGYHGIVFTPLTVKKWLRELNAAKDYLDSQFYEYSVENGYSVLRISEKFSMADNKPISDRPKMHWFYQEPYGYKAHAGLSLLYQLNYGFKMQPKEYIGETKVILHFYITGGD